jgi:threonine/homoserine/homoserine lactone efflux protein
VTEYFVLGATLAFAAAVQPGPYQTFLLAETLARGWRRTMPACVGPVLSDLPIATLAILVLSRMPAGAVRFLHLAGAIYLFYLAWGSFRTWQAFDPTHEPAGGRPGGTLLKAVTVNFLNPNPWLGWTLIMGPLFLEGWREAPPQGIALVAGFYGVMTLTLAGTITLFSFARHLGPKVNKVALGFSVVALAGFGVFQLWLGMTGS